MRFATLHPRLFFLALDAKSTLQAVPVPNRLSKLLLLAVLFFAGNMSRAQEKRAAPADLDVYDGFETATLSNLWEASRFAAGAVEMQGDIVRSGHGAAKITVRSNDKFEAGINGNSDSERAELLEARKLTAKENLAYEYSFSMFFPADFPIVPVRLVIAQWKQYCPEGGKCSDDSPVLAIRYIAGVLSITQDFGKKQVILYQKKDEFRKRWLDFKFRLRFSTDQNGRIDAWLDGQQVVNYKGCTANPESASTGYPNPSYFYFKMGLYRNVMPQPMTSYIDEYRKKLLRDAEF